MNYWGEGATLGKNYEMYFTNAYGGFNWKETNYLGHVKHPRRWGWDMLHNDLYMDLGDNAQMDAWAR